jgi:hypothetical protein
MILTNNVDKIKNKEKINVKCDYCSKLFYRAKGDVLGRKNDYGFGQVPFMALAIPPRLSQSFFAAI